MRAPATLALLLFGCRPEQEFTAFKRELSTDLATFDAGTVAVGDRYTLDLFPMSTATGEVTIYDVSVDDPDHWTVLETWKTADEEEGYPADGFQTVAGGTKDDPSYGAISVVFSPETEQEYRTVLTIVSNDTEVEERTEEGYGIWKVVLRGIGLYPCARVYPLHFDFGKRAAGGSFYLEGTIESCSNVTLTVADYDVAGSKSYYLETPMPIYVLPGSSEPFEVAYEPAGGAPPTTGILTFDLNDPDFTTEIELVGNDCTDSIDSTWDHDGDGWLAAGEDGSCGGDCDDNDPSVNPSALERAGNGIDDNCNGVVDEAASDLGSDDDGDGYTENDGDCDDNDPDIHPGATEVLNQVDDDCDDRIDEGTEWTDDDGDGYSEREGDCDDADVLVHPGAEEKQNDLDDDCDDIVDEGTYAYDDDGDGYAELDSPEADCDDSDPWSYPGATEDCDGLDNDCDGTVDEGEDGTEDGACAFLVDRKPSATPQKKGCSAVPGAAPGGLLGLIGLFGLAARRRQRLPDR